MTTPLCALIGFVFWTTFLVMMIGVVRVTQVISGKTAVNGFPSGQPHGTAAYWRLNRAHLNCIENLPLFAAVVLTGHLAGLTAGTFATLAVTYLLARITQSTIHITSGSAMAVNLRFASFLVQMVSLTIMSILIVTH